MNHDSISEIRSLLEAEGIALKKRFGQNFLIRSEIRGRIAGIIEEGLATVSDLPEDPLPEVWEIGPGLGALTDRLLAFGYPLRVFEIDRALIRILHRRYGDTLTIEEGDAIDRFPALFSDSDAALPVAVVGNLPYRSASAMVAALVEGPRQARGVGYLVFLVQEELASRLAAQPGSGDYSALSVLIQNSYRVERGPRVPGSAFYPAPRVSSRIIRLVAREDAPVPALRRVASLVARQAFAQRRKTLRNTLSSITGYLEEAGIDPSARPETIEPARFLALARIVENLEDYAP